MSAHKDFKHGELTQRIIAVFYEVYNELGHGFAESVYEKSMLIALRDAGLLVQHKHPHGAVSGSERRRL